MKVLYACVAGIAVLLGTTSCTSCVRICTPETNDELRRIGDEIDSSCETIAIYETELITLEGLEPLRSAGTLDVARNPRLEDFSALRKVELAAATFVSNLGADDVRIGSIGAGILAVEGNNARQLTLSLFQPTGLSTPMVIEVGEEMLERLSLVADEDPLEIALTVFNTDESRRFEPEYTRVSLATLRMVGGAWVDAIPALDPFGVPTNHVLLYGTAIAPQGPVADEYFAWLTARGFEGAMEICEGICDGDAQETWDDSRCGGPPARWRTSCRTLPRRPRRRRRRNR